MQKENFLLIIFTILVGLIFSFFYKKKIKLKNIKKNNIFFLAVLILTIIINLFIKNIWLDCLALFIFINIIFLNNNLKIKKNKEKKASKKIIILSVILLTFIGLWLRVANLGVNNFKNDEFFHLETAVGHINTGQYVRWDFLKEDVKIDKNTNNPLEYKRAWPYTWQVVQSFKFFEISEFAGRLPSIFWGVLTLPLIFLIIYHASKSSLISFLVLFLAVFDDFLIKYSRMMRMYSMLIFFSLLVIYFFYLGVEHKFKKKKYNIIFLSSSFLLLIFSYFYIHEIIILFIPGMALYFFIIFIKNYFQKQKLILDKYFFLSFLSLISFIIVLIVNYKFYQIIPAYFVTIRQMPHYIYYFYSFEDFNFSSLAFGIFLIGLFSLNYKNKFYVYFYSLIFPALIFFVYFSQRYDAKRYISFIVPLFLIIFCINLKQIIFKINFKNNKINVLILILLFLLIGPKISFPGINESFFTKIAFSDKNHLNNYEHNYEKAYNYVLNNYKENETILIQEPRYFYFSNKDVNTISLRRYKKLTYKKFIKIIEENSDSWIIWDEIRRDKHIRPKIIEYVKNNFKKIKGLEDINIEIYKSE